MNKNHLFFIPLLIILCLTGMLLYTPKPTAESEIIESEKSNIVVAVSDDQKVALIFVGSDVVHGYGLLDLTNIMAQLESEGFKPDGMFWGYSMGYRPILIYRKEPFNNSVPMPLIPGDS